MSTALGTHDDKQHLVLNGVSWAYYERTLEEVGNQPIRVAFLDGKMELMSPLPEHESMKDAIGDLIWRGLLSANARFREKHTGQQHSGKKEKAAGSEPDGCFYFNAEIDSVKGMKLI